MAELAVFMVPVNVMTYLPNFYFGGVIAWIGQDILKASVLCCCLCLGCATWRAASCSMFPKRRMSRFLAPCTVNLVK